MIFVLTLRDLRLLVIRLVGKSIYEIQKLIKLAKYKLTITLNGLFRKRVFLAYHVFKKIPINNIFPFLGF